MYGGLLTGADAPRHGIVIDMTDHNQDTRRDSTLSDDALVLTANLLPYRGGPWRPELSLVAAVFQDAVRCAQRAGRGVTHRQSEEAVEWIASERCDWPFAFLNVCDFLGVDAAAVRAQLELRETSPRPRARSRSA